VLALGLERLGELVGGEIAAPLEEVAEPGGHQVLALLGRCR
jgi:hypothetical protein